MAQIVERNSKVSENGNDHVKFLRIVLKYTTWKNVLSYTFLAFIWKLTDEVAEDDNRGIVKICAIRVLIQLYF